MQSDIGTIPNKAQISRVEYHPEFSAICSIGQSPFCGFIDIVYEPADVLLEFESFEIWLRSISTERTTVEDLARFAFDKLSDALGDIPLSVQVNARTTVHAPISAIIERSKK